MKIKALSTIPSHKTNLVAKATTKWHALFAAWLGEAFDAMDASLYIVALYPAVSELLRSKNDIEIGQTGSVILATFMLGWFLGALLFGTLADKIGRRKTMLVTILIYSIATGLCAIAQNWVQFAACRFIVGCGIGGEIILGTIVVSEFWKNRGRLWAICALESSFNIGLLLSAGINAVLGPYGWRWLFVAGIIPALFTVYIRSKLKESSHFEEVQTHRQNLSRQFTELTKADHIHLRLPIYQLMQPDLRTKTIAMALLGISATIGYWASVAWLPAWINQLTGTLAVNQRSLVTTTFSIAGLIGCFITPFVLDKLGRKGTMKLTFGGALLTAVMMFISVKVYSPVLLVWASALGLFTNIQFAALQIYIPEVFPTSVLATATGICYGGGRIFAAALALCGGQLIAFYGGSYALAAATISTIYILGFVAAFFAPATNGETAGTMLTEANSATVPEFVDSH